MTITSRKNDAVKRFREVLRDKSLRDSEGVFAVEGDHLCGELAAGGFRIISAMATEKALEKYPQTAGAMAQAGELAVISGDIAEYISDTRAPQGLFALAEKPAAKPELSGASRLVLLDGVQDPGNVGTIIRTAEALGFGGAAFAGLRGHMGSENAARFDGQRAQASLRLRGDDGAYPIPERARILRLRGDAGQNRPEAR